ncbi:MAG: menaquinone biosynthesis protein [Rubrivivax sp.]|nr:menaquinone biosynthesis protein [Pyrinomonadaceae bacterium]
MREEIGKDSESGGAPRVAASSYLNTAPLIWSFARGPRCSEVELLTDAAPARCAELLARGEAEAALVPVIEYQRLPETAVVPGVCVGARSEVQSVVLVTRGAPLEEVGSVALDTSSRTSAALVEVIFREFVGHAPRLVPSAPNQTEMLRAHEAALLIGDPAMTFPREGLRVYDMAGLWRRFTGLGFVFAMWMAHEGARARVETIDFAGARDEGLERVGEIASEYEKELGRPREELVSYLRDNICFELDDEMRAGLELFFRLAHKHGVTDAQRPLKFFGL